MAVENPPKPTPRTKRATRTQPPSPPRAATSANAPHDDVIHRGQASGQPTLSVRAQLEQHDAAHFIGTALSATSAPSMHEHHIAPAGPPFTISHPAGHHQLDVEAGWPLDAPAAGSGRIHGGMLPRSRLRAYLGRKGPLG